MLDKILETVEVNLCDSYSRFLLTKEYEQYMAKNGVVQLLMEKGQESQIRIDWLCSENW